MLQHASTNALLLCVPQLPRPIFPRPSHRPQILKKMARPHFPRVQRHITGSPESSMGHMDQVRKGTCSTQPGTPTNTTIPTSALPHMPNLHIDWLRPPKNRITHAPKSFSCMHMPSMAPPPAIKWVGSPSPPIGATRKWLYFTSSTPTTFAQYPSRTGQKKNFCMPTARPMSG